MEDHLKVGLSVSLNVILKEGYPIIIIDIYKALNDLKDVEFSQDFFLRFIIMPKVTPKQMIQLKPRNIREK